VKLEKAKCQHAVGKKVLATECNRGCTTGCNSVVYTSIGTVSVETPYRYEHVQQRCQHAEAQAQKESREDNDPAASSTTKFHTRRGTSRVRLEGAFGAELNMSASVYKEFRKFIKFRHRCRTRRLAATMVEKLAIHSFLQGF